MRPRPSLQRLAFAEQRRVDRLVGLRAGRVADDRLDVGERDGLAVARHRGRASRARRGSARRSPPRFSDEKLERRRLDRHAGVFGGVADERFEARAFDLIGRKRDGAPSTPRRLFGAGSSAFSSAASTIDPRRLGRPVEQRLQRADDVVAAVEDAKRNHRLAAEERGGIRFVGDAAGLGGELVGADAEHRLAAAALQRKLLERAGALGDRAGIAAVDQEQPDAFRRRLQEAIDLVRLTGRPSSEAS